MNLCIRARLELISLFFSDYSIPSFPYRVKSPDYSHVSTDYFPKNSFKEVSRGPAGSPILQYTY